MVESFVNVHIVGPPMLLSFLGERNWSTKKAGAPGYWVKFESKSMLPCSYHLHDHVISTWITHATVYLIFSPLNGIAPTNSMYLKFT